MNKLVSVIIPSYNAANYLDETLQSVLSQTYKEIEIIVVDDGSKDNTRQVLSNYKDKIKCIYQENQGVSVARNNGFASSLGDFICFLDADDWFYPTNIEEKVQIITRGGAGLVHSWVEITDPYLKPIDLLKGKAGENLVNELLNLIPPAIPCPSNVLIKRDVLNAVGLFDSHLNTSADFDLWLRIAHEFKVDVIERPLIKYRTTPQSMFSNIDLLIHNTEYIVKKYSALAQYKSYHWNHYKKRSYYSIAGGLYHRKRYADFALFFSKYALCCLISLLKK